MRVLGNYTVVELASQTTVLDNGLAINNETQSRKDIVTGTVIKTNNPDLKDGELIYFPLYAANMVTFKGKAYYVVDNRDVLLVDDTINS